MCYTQDTIISPIGKGIYEGVVNSMPKRSFDLSANNTKGLINIMTGESMPQNTQQIICERIRHFRKALGYDQQELASRIGVTANAVSNWERERARPDINLLPKICDALGITLYDLYGLEGANAMLSSSELQLIDQYRRLSPGNRHAVSVLANTLLQVQSAERGRKVLKLINCERALAAGVGDPSEFEDAGEPIYLYDSILTSRADFVFRVNGDSMEPDYPHASRVLVERLPNNSDMRFGEVGAFISGNEAYIKVYEADGLHSLNKKYKPIHFEDGESVYLIGRVLGLLDENEIASQDDIDSYLMLNPS